MSFFWLSQINKATFVVNTRSGLLDPRRAPGWARAQRRVIEKGNTPGNPRPKMYVRYEPLLIAEAGIDVTLIHAGRSSQDMHAVYQRAMLRDQTLEVMTALNSVRETLFRLAKEKPGHDRSLLYEWGGGSAEFARAHLARTP